MSDPPNAVKKIQRGHLAATTNITRRNWPFTVVFGCYHHHALLISPHTRRNRALVLIFGGCSPSLAATTTTAYQPPPTTAKIEHSCSFSAVVGFLWPLPPPPLSISPPQLPKSSIRACFRWLWAFSGCHHNDYPSTSPYNCWNRALMLIFGGCGLSCCHHNPSNPYNGRKRAFVLIFSCCRLPLAATTTPAINLPPITAEIECLCSFSAVVGFLAATATTVHQPPTFNCRNRAFALVFGGCGLSLAATTRTGFLSLYAGLLLAPTTHQPPQPPKSSICTRFRR